MIPLSNNLPLRETTLWSAFRLAEVIPHRYGVTGGKCLQYNQERTVFVWADHPVVGITEVLVNGDPVSNWQALDLIDSTGKAVTAIQFAEAQDEGSTITAKGQGKPHPTLGGVMDNPADVVMDILSLSGRALDTNRLARFRNQCASLGLQVAGSLNTMTTPQDAVRSVCLSIGAFFALDSQEYCYLLGFELGGPIREVGKTHASEASVEGDDLINDLTLRFAFEDGNAGGSVRVEAPESIAAYDRRAEAIDAYWIADPRLAYEIAVRSLSMTARPRWNLRLLDVSGRPLIGDVLRVTSAQLDFDGLAHVVNREYDFNTKKSSIGVVVPAGDPVTPRLVSQALRIAPNRYASVEFETVGGQRILTITDSDNQPLPFATVVLDGTITRTSDAAGKVSFPSSIMPPGQHTLQITAPDGSTLTTIVTVD